MGGDQEMKNPHRGRATSGVRQEAELGNGLGIMALAIAMGFGVPIMSFAIDDTGTTMGCGVAAASGLPSIIMTEFLLS